MFSQDPNAVLDYTIGWTDWLPSGDTISSAVWTVQNVTPPTQLTITTANTGGNLTAGTYYWVITALDVNGETTVSNEVSASWAQANGVATLSWQRVPNATGYKLYRGTAAGGENKLIVTISGSAVTSYIDNGNVAGTTATPPTVNTAALGVTIATTPAPSITSTTTTAYVRGGTAGVVYTVACHITTAGGLQAEWYLTISIDLQYLP